MQGTYRLLDNGETIKQGDEYYDMYDGKWYLSKNTGNLYVGNLFPVRRKITLEALLEIGLDFARILNSTNSTK